MNSSVGANHSHSSHDHSGHDHSGHDHSGHDHSGHDHSHAGHNHSHAGDKTKPDLQILKQEMAKGMEELDAEWIKRDAMKNMFNHEPENPMLPQLQDMPAIEFKTKMIESIGELDDDQFVSMLQQDNILDSEGYLNTEMMGGSDEGQGYAKPNYGFEPRKTLDFEELQKRLTDQQFQTTQYGIPEKENTGKYLDHFEEGKYNCVGCYTNLFSSKHKYKSTKGYAAFNDRIGDVHELSFGVLTEAKCENCGAHLGDIVKDDPGSTSNKSYMVNSNSLNFEAGKFID